MIRIPRIRAHRPRFVMIASRTNSSVRVSGATVIAIGILTYLVVPGHVDLPLHGIPLGLTGSVVASIAVITAILGRRVPLAPVVTITIVVLIAALAALRVAAAVTAIPQGWEASYFANEHWHGPPQWSSDFRWSAATRRDRTLSFEGVSFPVHYLNGHTFARGSRREVTEPLSVIWTGETSIAATTTVEFGARFTGRIDLSVGDSPVFAKEAASPDRVTERRVLQPGRHTLRIRYVKPSGIDGLITFDARVVDTGATLQIHPANARGVASSVLRQASGVADGAIVAILAGLLIVVWATRWKDRHQRHAQMIATVVVLLFGIQGWWAAVPLEGRYAPLGAGDDWFGFESRARDILQHGPLMLLDAPRGQGAPYFYHPFYSYFLAAVHAVTGESLAGPIFVQFLLLAAVAIIMWTLTRRLFGAWPAVLGTAALIGLFQLDFTRYYTVTLLSENLYVLTVTCTLVAFARWAEKGRKADLAATGLWAGLSSITRPAMMVFLVPALLVAGVIALKRPMRLADALLAMALLSGVWLAVVAPVTLRNWVVSGRPVLISEGVGAGFIRYNVPEGVDADDYLTQYSGSAGSGLIALARIAWDHPWQVLALQANKIGFSLGMVHWRNGYRPHPELVAATLLFVTMWWLSPTMRSPALWPFLAFVVAHVASMGLTDPANYGYRLILPPFIYTTTLGVAALAERWFRGRAPYPPDASAGMAA